MKKLYAKIFAMLALAFSLSNLAFGQEMEVSGKVTDAKDGSGLPGVTVLVIGTTNGAITDINGTYNVKATPGATLEFRFLGFTTERRIVGANGTVDNVSMSEEVKNLKEAVVIGYGSVRKKDLTGAVTSISSKDFQSGTITTADQLISGKAAGVQITPNGGSPGAGATIRIRGGASLNASNDPLYVIDGVPVQGGIDGSPNPLGLINPNDIENITILRDASAAAIYGSRASNGVILITTKKGTKGAAPTLSFSSQNSVAVIPKYVDVLSAAEFRKIVSDSGTTPQKALIKDSTTSTDWQKEIFQLARTLDQNLSYGGSLFGVPYRISAGYLNQTGILKTDVMDRITGAINVSPSFMDGSLKLNVNLKGSYSSNQFANQGAIGAAVGFDPTKPVYSTDTSRLVRGRYDGYYEWLDAKGRPLSLAPRNPVAMLYQTKNRSFVYRSLGNVTLDYTPTFFPDLTASLNLGYDISNGHGVTSTSDSSALSYETKGNSGRYKQENSNLLGEFTLRYLKEIGSIHSKIEFLAGTSFQKFATTNTFYRGLNYRGDTIAGTKPLLFPNDKPENRIQSFYSRLIYTFYNRYILTATAREDGSSRFGRTNRWGFFPSAALAWEISEEGFMKKLPVVSNLKLRLSYGETGQQDIGANYAYLPRYSVGQPTVMYPFGDQYNTMYAPIAYDPNIKWETTTSYNAAIDYGFFDERITGSVDFYLKKTSDMLNTIPVPSGSNFSDQVLTNVGGIENKGVEFSINTIPVQKDNLVWNVGFNVTYNENKITKLVSVTDSNYLGVPTGGIGLGRNIQLNSIGSPLNGFYVLEQYYDSKGKPVEGQFVDQNGDGKITEKDFVKKHQPTPKMFFGFNTNVTWNRLTVGMVVRANYGNYVFTNQVATSGSYANILTSNPFLNNGSGNITETNFDGNLGNGVNNINRYYSSYYLRDASFIRFDNINFSYDFGKVWSKLRVAANLNIQNALVITKYKGIDPEMFSGIDNNIYPRPRVFVLGLSLTY